MVTEEEGTFQSTCTTSYEKLISSRKLFLAGIADVPVDNHIIKNVFQKTKIRVQL